ncbi:hypothetical protein BJF79_08775 [Actinomadura sp. CNU-125]|uniref:hypothetical protein n=1 Tax=Actinomadura sp. CNU-125 TaxID=1904961 RepID=UPI00095CD8FB|nr:hypothetical protein [Actinomadura sp. CNU-125]OLT31878.1 hypothetical protein BJF79_08775 [Actinomadura sp. CNU-125]
MKQHFEHIAQQICSADGVPALLATALTGLEVIERATAHLADLAPAHSYPGYQTARAEAITAWSVLSTAPTLNSSPARPSSTGPDVEELAASIAAFVLVVAEAIVNVAAKTPEPGDRVACLRAARHAGHIHTALR